MNEADIVKLEQLLEQRRKLIRKRDSGMATSYERNVYVDLVESVEKEIDQIKAGFER